MTNLTSGDNLTAFLLNYSEQKKANRKRGRESFSKKTPDPFLPAFTTPEHPFYVRPCSRDAEGFRARCGWTAAGALQPGDEIRTDIGWATVEEVFDTGTYETVYNLRVADHHTYFVGEEGWRERVWAHNTCDDALEALAASTEMSSRGVTKSALAAVKEIKSLFSPAFKVQQKSLKDFKQELELALDRAGFLSTGQYLTSLTAINVKAAAEVPRGSRIDISKENPFAEGTGAYQTFATKVLQNPIYRGYYNRIINLVKAGVDTAIRLIENLPGGQHAGRVKGLAYQLSRTEAYQRAGQLVEVEMSLGGGEVDIVLTGGQLVDPKAWKQTWWDARSEDERQAIVADERTKIIKYLTATSTVQYKLRLEFKYFVPAEMAAMIADLASQPDFAGRIDAQVVL